MGWWNSIVSGVSNAASWTVDHSSDIGAVVGTVAQVAALVAAEESSEEVTILQADDPFDMPTFITSMNKAEGVLVKKATTKSTEVLDAKATKAVAQCPPLDPPKPLSSTYTGLWTKPVIANNGLGLPGQEMTADLSHMLAMHGFPQTLKTEGGDIDVAQLLGTSIFATPPNTLEDANGVNVVSSELSLEDGSQHIICTHAYYAIPFTDDTNVWHAAVNLTTTQTPSAQKAYHEERRCQSKVSAPFKLAVDVDADYGMVWQVSMNILWTAASYAVKAAPLLVNYLKQSDVILEIKFNNTDGLTTFFQVVAKKGQTPFQVREAVVTAANQAVIEVGVPSVTGVTTKQIKDAPFQPKTSGMTQVEITAKSYIDYSTSSTPSPGLATKKK